MLGLAAQCPASRRSDQAGLPAKIEIMTRFGQGRVGDRPRPRNSISRRFVPGQRGGVSVRPKGARWTSRSLEVACERLDGFDRSRPSRMSEHRFRSELEIGGQSEDHLARNFGAGNFSLPKHDHGVPRLHKIAHRAPCSNEFGFMTLLIAAGGHWFQAVGLAPWRPPSVRSAGQDGARRSHRTVACARRLAPPARLDWQFVAEDSASPQSSPRFGAIVKSAQLRIDPGGLMI